MDSLKNMRQLYTLLFLLLSLCGYDSAKAERALFAHYTVEDGLSSNSVYGISQDTSGFIWMATRFGICRFDGANFLKFNSTTDSVICRNDIYFSFLLPNGKPAFSSENSVLLAYDELSGSFSDISSFLPGDKYMFDVKGFKMQPDGNGLLATACGLYRFDVASNQFLKHLPAFNGYALDVCSDKYGRNWIGHFNGWQILDSLGNVLPGCDFKGEPVMKMYHIDAEHMLICPVAGGIWLATLAGPSQPPVVSRVDAPFTYVTALTAGTDGDFWMGTMADGLWKAHFSSGRFTFDRVVPLNQPAEPLTKISALFTDCQGNVWVGTQCSGLWRTASTASSTYIKSKDVGFPVGVGASFCQVAGGDILMGTDGMGLFRFTEDLWLKDQVAGLSNNSVLSMVNDGGDCLVGFWCGKTNRFNPATAKVTEFVYSGLPDALFATKHLMRTPSGEVFVATAGDGVYCGTNGSWRRVQLSDTSMLAYPDLWFEGTCAKPDGSVRLYSSRTIWSNLSGHFRAILPDADKSLEVSPLHINHCTANAQNMLFAATNLGLFAFGADDKPLGRLDFVPPCEYASVLVDSKGTLWTSGVCGILAIDLKNRTYQLVMPDDEMPSRDYFTDRACLQSASGNIFFGCTEGFVCLQPGVQPEKQIDLLGFSLLSIRGEVVPVGGEVLPAPLNRLKELELDYSQNHFSLGFNLIDFSLANNIMPKYRIPQIDSVWIELGDKRSVDVAFLPAGTFDVQLAAFSGNVPVKVVSLKVKVSPPWWQSPWFRCLVVVLLGAVLYAFYRVRMRRQIEQKRQLQLMVDERTRSLNQVNLLLEQQKATVEKANLSLLNTLKQKDQLVSVVGHDLKNPMFAIVSTLKRMLTSVFTPAQQQQLLQKLVAEAEGLQHQMVELVEWASADVTNTVCQPSAVDANQLVADALGLLGGLAREKDICLQQVGATCFATWADARMLSTVVRNLVTNAIKFSPKGSRVVVHLQEADGKTLLEVEDSGLGISEEKVRQILSGQKVSSTSGTDSEAGFGFGLPIVVEYARKNGGDVAIASLPGQGTTVRVSLPLCSAQPIAAPAAPVASEKSEVNIEINRELLVGKTILVVDDDELILEHISSLISPYVDVLRAHDGVEGVALAQSHVPDLIISDVDMPNLNGIDMFRQLSSQLITSNIPLLFLSAKTDNSVRLEGLSIGAIDYIAKPFADDELLVKICNFLLWQQKIQVGVLTRSLEGNEDETAEAVNPLLEKILGLIKENYANSLYSLADLVSALGMSKATLSRRMKSISDKTPMEILTEYRLNMARKMLEAGDKSVSDVAYAVGFNDPSYFSRRFKEVFGSSPKQMR